MTKNTLRAFLAVGALSIGSSVAMGCVADRPSRNGVFNESQYLRKAFLVGASDSTAPDPGWFMKATIQSTTTPNPYAELNLFTGAEGTQFVRFSVTSDTVEVLNMRELAADTASQKTRTPELLNAWPATNVDIKYRVNLDGEKTNFVEENQELDWQQRQYVKVNLGKNSVNDLAALGEQAAAIITNCSDSANAISTLVPDSFRVDEASNYVQWAVQVTLPYTSVANPMCTYGAGPSAIGSRIGRQATTFNILYSMTRATALDTTSPTAYVPLEIAEKDPIRRKYGTIDTYAIARDPATGLLGARQLANRFNPKKPLVYYFAPGYPEQYKGMFTDPNGIVYQTNALFTDAKADIRLTVKNFDDDMARPDGAPDCDPKAIPAPCTTAGGIAAGMSCLKDSKGGGNFCGYPRSFGDVRYNMIRWEDDIDTGSPFIGVTQFVADPRTGELISSSVNIAAFQLTDAVTARLDFYLESIGAQMALDPVTGEWPPGPANCKDGDVIPFDPAVNTLNHNAKSTIYAKMQEYLQKPAAVFGKLGPQDFIVPQDADFFNAYFQMIPYQLYADPAANFFVTPEGGRAAFGPTAQFQARAKNTDFHNLMADLDHGVAPYDTSLGATGLASGAQFLDKFHRAQLDHNRAMYMKNFNHGTAQFDDSGLISLMQVFERDARHCVNGVWETRKQYIDSLVQSYHALTVWHEFGHAIGLDHNFMASVDRPNFPHYKDAVGRDHIGMYQSSVMEYNATPDRVFWKNASGGQGWGPYDQGAISFIYANSNANPDTKAPKALGISGQTSPTQPWNDPHGYKADGKTEQAYLFCNANHLQYSPLCHQFDFGSTPSEIIAAQIDSYEWNYKWRNFRLYHKFADFSAYADAPTQIIHDMRRFMPMWTFDWSHSEITDTLRRIGVAPPTGAVAATYYDQLVDKFTADISGANAMVGAFHEALIQQGSGERPYKTIYDNFYGDTTQQGIFLDKLIALQSWTDIWQVDNFDPDQAGGVYLSSYSSEFGDPVYQTVAETAVDSMIGGQYDVFPFARPLAVMQFSKATHDVNFSGRTEIRDWTGGKVFFREADFLNFFRTLQVQFNTTMSAQSNVGPAPFTCSVVATCPYDPRVKQARSTDVNHSDSYNEFLGPDNRRYAWIFVQDRNQWVVVDRDRNTAAYLIVRQYNTDVVKLESDGNFGPDLYGDLRQVKYFMDLFQQYN